VFEVESSLVGLSLYFNLWGQSSPQLVSIIIEFVGHADGVESWKNALYEQNHTHMISEVLREGAVFSFLLVQIFENGSSALLKHNLILLCKVLSGKLMCRKQLRCAPHLAFLLLLGDLLIQ
jgi:hypothetical protein